MKIDKPTQTFENANHTHKDSAGGGAAQAASLKSATTDIDVSAATAPVNTQVLTATSSTTATWQTPTAVPVKASAAEVDTGTDDAKFVTSLSIANSHNVPNTVPSTSGNLMTSNGTDWISSPPATVGTVTSVASGNGMNFTTITSTGTVTLGTPSSVTSTSTNSVTSTSHTHAVDSTILPLTTKGDVYVYSTAATRLPVGTNGQILSADSTQTTGLLWENPSASSFIVGETPSGTINGSNTAFTLANTPITGTVKIYLNGQRLTVTADYSVSGTALTMVVAPLTGDVLLADYQISSGTFATGSASWVSNEVPSGTVNGSNQTFTLVSTPITGTLALYRDGQLMVGGGADYTLTTNSIAFVTAPVTGSVLLAFYQSSASVAGNADTLDGFHANDFSNNDGSLITDYKGWQKVNETWTYASASTITIASGGASRYQVGDKIKWTQTTVKYGVIVAVSDTLLTIAVNTDYVVANAAISAIFVSREEIPFGFPEWFNWTPTAGAAASMTISAPTVNIARFNVKGRTVNYFCYVSLTTGGSASNTITLTAPITPREYTSQFYPIGSGLQSISTSTMLYVQKNTGSALLQLLKYDTSNYALAAGDVRAAGSYEI